MVDRLSRATDGQTPAKAMYMRVFAEHGWIELAQRPPLEVEIAGAVGDRKRGLDDAGLRNRFAVKQQPARAAIGVPDDREVAHGK